MQRVIDHPTILETRTELSFGDDERSTHILHVDTRLVLTPGAPYYSEKAVTEFVEVVERYRQKHGIRKVFLHERS